MVKKIIILLSILFLFTACQSKPEVKEEKKVAIKVVKNENKTAVKVVKKKSRKYRNEVKNFRSEVDGLKIKLMWDIKDTEELGKIELYQKIMPRGKRVKIQDLDSSVREFEIELEELSECMFRIKLISKDGRSSYGRETTPSMIFTARDNFFE